MDPRFRVLLGYKTVGPDANGVYQSWSEEQIAQALDWYLKELKY